MCTDVLPIKLKFTSIQLLRLFVYSTCKFGLQIFLFWILTDLLPLSLGLYTMQQHPRHFLPALRRNCLAICFSLISHLPESYCAVLLDRFAAAIFHRWQTYSGNNNNIYLLRRKAQLPISVCFLTL